MGNLFFVGVNERDYFLLMGILLIASVFVVLMNIIADVLYVWADPRIRLD
jgi:ABC-type dipeptide/oligopeptide/nickel transport system permease component